MPGGPGAERHCARVPLQPAGSAERCTRHRRRELSNSDRRYGTYRALGHLRLVRSCSLWVLLNEIKRTCASAKDIGRYRSPREVITSKAARALTDRAEWRPPRRAHLRVVQDPPLVPEGVSRSVFLIIRSKSRTTGWFDRFLESSLASVVLAGLVLCSIGLFPCACVLPVTTPSPGGVTGRKQGQRLQKLRRANGRANRNWSMLRSHPVSPKPSPAQLAGRRLGAHCHLKTRGERGRGI